MDKMINTNQDLNQLIKGLQDKRSRLAEKLEEIDKQLEAALLTSALLRGGEVREPEETLPAVSNQELRGMTQLQAIVHIARKNNGRIRTADAAKILMRTGLMTKTKNSYNIAYNVIKRSQQFKLSGTPGEYELIQEENPVVLMQKRVVS